MIAQLATLTLALAVVSPAPAQETCSSDTFSIDGRSVDVSVCGPTSVPKPTKGQPSIQLRETVGVRGGVPLVREVALATLPDEGLAHTIDDVPLQKLGIERTLHVTLAYKPGTVRLEHALLIPGAVVLK